MKKSSLYVALFCTASTLIGCNSSTDDVTVNTPNSTLTEPAEGTQLKIRLLETTDIHANLLNYNYFSDKQDDKVGLVKTATLIRAARDEVSNTILVDNGDLIQGSPLGDYMAKVKQLQPAQVHPVYKAMNTLDYDVANIGNHEFNFGIAFLQEAINDANFPYISANTFVDDGDNNPDNDKPLFAPYLIQEKSFIDNQGKQHNLKVGFIGFVPPQIMQWDKANLSGKVIAKDIVAMANKYVPEMQAAGADLIIAIPHSGIDTSEPLPLAENASYYLSQVDGIDAILFGHSHANFPGKNYADMQAFGIDNDKGTINGVAAVMPGFWGNHLGQIDLSLEYTSNSWQVTDSQSSLQAIYKTDENRMTISLVENDGAVESEVMVEHDETRTWVNQPFAKVSGPINSYFALVNDDPSIQIVTDAQTWYTQKIIQGTELDGLPILSAGAPFRAGRGGSDDYTAIDAGEIAYRNVADLYIYPNILKVLKLNGAQVKQWLEMSAGQFNQIDTQSAQQQNLINDDFPSYNFDVIDGVNYQIDITQAARYNSKGDKISDAERIKALTYQGNPVTDEQLFLVVTNNYRASGGGNFPAITSDKIVIDSPNENRQVVADYLTEQTRLNSENGLDPAADMNWSFSPIANVNILFKSANNADAKSYSQQFSHIQTTAETTSDGFAIYSLDLSPK
ncbi:bifunctional 2',3'-cyclic-nucleotide 2'-phosphodiesterase/3'-nucleotidase [Psychromonas sp. psych-6C06]|uniref:bifunctional 2',3'-cyclic-nucleotide 2'-phosphodiesterase/3'-nucleotidase n=1 Tax=Psychromonas sp. psych-6C06 TaxID=2058089 RepID=UPI000C3212CB|nr:bifunctional 2',3'-cyclic-nucleotide 2'-phosphodiesterase/3'-nucleotidase [Psychromonas sp. psych-6C06]PKF62516.1 bifunctional 2',3'-cyclic-nucleotide 2'-phosphodiesterase/3'-nucleotidase [Psychromonas sp. psych-6C06]